MSSPGPARDRGLEPYLRAIRARLRVVCWVLAVALAASAVLVTLHAPTYEASAKLLIDPWPQSDTAALDVGLLRETGDPTRTLETAVALIESNASAEATARRLGEGWTAERVRDATRVEVEGESNVIQVIAGADSPAGAARIANAFAEGVLQGRKASFERRVGLALEQAQQQLANGDLSEEAAARLGERLSQLQALQAGGDPTIVLADAAREPNAVSGAPRWLLIALSAVAAIAIALGAALLLEMLDPRVQDDDDITSAYPVHVLASVPRLSRRERRQSSENPLEVIPRIRETFRTIQVQVEQVAARTGSGPIVMFTSPSRADGKTTTALNYALTAAAEGHRVILLDLDMHEHDLTRRTGLLQQAASAAALADDTVSLDSLLVQTELPNLAILPTRGALDIGLAGAFLRRLPAVLSHATSRADRVVIDTAPLGEVSDPLRIALSADHVLLVARPGNTNRGQLELARDLLERSAAPVRGLVVVGTRGAGGSGYGYGYGHRSALEDATAADPRAAVTTS